MDSKEMKTKMKTRRWERVMRKESLRKMKMMSDVLRDGER
jgi:hypothetical protein